MPNDPRELRARTPIVLTWGMPAERDSLLADAAVWLAGGAMLLLWTGLAFVLTSA